MNNKIIKLTVLILACYTFAACNDDFLERRPKGVLNEDNAFKTYETCVAYQRNFYQVFTGAALYFPGPMFSNGGNGSSEKDMWSGLLTNYNKGFSNINNGYAAQEQSIPISSSFYSYPYEMIKSTNIFLNHKEDPKATEKQKLHLESVARFIRAYCHFALMWYYSDIIYVDKVITDTDPQKNRPRDSRLYVADQIYKELKWCIDNIQDDLAEPNTINSNVIKAFFTRFALFEGTWRKYHQTQEDSRYVSGATLLTECEQVAKAMVEANNNLYRGDGHDLHKGAGWGQMWTSQDLSKVPSVLLYIKYIEDKKMHRMGHFEHIASAYLEMPQSTVDLYLTEDGLPIHNKNVKTYEYNGVDKTYTQMPQAYDYANVDPYKTFRKRDPRLCQMVIPPYSVNTKGTNGWTFNEGSNGMYSEYVHQFSPRGVLQKDGSYLCPDFSKGYNQILTHKSLPSSNWAGNILPSMPNTQMSNKANANQNGKIGYYGNKGFQRGKSGYFVWKQVANWDKQNPNGGADIAHKPVFKMEEVMLNYAEAAYENGHFNQDVADATINRLRKRAQVGAMVVSNINTDFDPDRDPSVEPVLWEVRRERLIELMGESFSFEDIRRWKTAPWFINKQHYGAWVNADNLDAVISKTEGETGLLDNATGNEASRETVLKQGGGHLFYYLSPINGGKGWLEKYYLFPIPIEELTIDGSMLEQQPLWK